MDKHTAVFELPCTAYLSFELRWN